MKKINDEIQKNENEDDLYLIFKNDDTGFQSLKREIIFDITKNKYYLYNKEKNKIYNSNFFGKKIYKINTNNLGKLSFKERLRKNLIDRLEYKFDDNLYVPRMKYFDGFSQIPRPLIQPFYNNKDKNEEKNKNEKTKQDMINYIKNKDGIITNDKYKEILSRNKSCNSLPPKDLNYYSNNLANSVNGRNKNYNKNKVIKYINNSLKNEDLNLKQKHSLKIFKSNLLNNSNSEINGVKLSDPKKIFNKRYKINQIIMFVNPIKSTQANRDAEINHQTYRILYKSINNNKITKLINKQNYQFKERKVNTNRYYRPNSVINFKNKYEIYTPERQEFKKSESKKYDTEENLILTFNNKLNKKIHSIDYIIKDFNKEKKYIKGFKKPLRKPNIILRKGIPKYKSMKELYKKEMDLFKLVNPDKIKMEEDENEKRDNYLKKKIENERKIKIIKNKNFKEKASRINSAFSNVIKDVNENYE